MKMMKLVLLFVAILPYLPLTSACGSGGGGDSESRENGVHPTVAATQRIIGSCVY